MKEIFYFTAPWCKSCANLKPHIARIKEQGITVHEIDVESDLRTAEEYDVMQLPTVILIENDAIISRKTGFSQSVVVELNNFARSCRS